MQAASIHLSLFGPPAVVSGAVTVALPFERRTQVAVLLALRRRWVPRAEVAAMLWPELESKLAYANLRKTLFRLHALPWAAAIETQGTSLRWEVATDVEGFESALRDQRLDDALQAYAGELLAGFDDGTSEAWTRWLGFERERLRSAWRGVAMGRLAGAGTPLAEAMALSGRLLDADPLDEAALQQHMTALANDGQAGAARQAYRQFVDRLSTDLGLEPGTQLRALHDSLGAAPRPAPASRAEPTQGRASDDGFVGRSIELQRIADLLGRGECRLLCLIGPGGVGKTRLARRALQDLAPRFEDGAVYVALDDVETPDAFSARLAVEAAVKGSGRGGDALAPVIAAWRDRALLLVLDNFEQLAEHAPLLDGLMQGCPRLKILLTSRLRLAVAGEWSMPIEGLPCPDPEDDDLIESFDAVRLFVGAARRVEPDFSAAAESAAIVDICRQVGGLPLALELAASWVRMLSCAAIADELRHGTELLRATDLRHPSRHASIETVFEHSWRRLGAAERDALARLSVFRGGFSFEAARAVTEASLPVLGALADKSLLAKDGPRMHLHPLVQQLAALRFDAPQLRAAELAHAAWFMDWLAQLRLRNENAEGAALRAIDTELENCRQAWRISAREGWADLLRACARVVSTYCDYRGRVEEGWAWMRETLDSPASQADPALRAHLASQCAYMQYRMGRFEAAQSEAADVLRIARPARDRDTRIQALTVLAGCALQQGRLPDARRRYMQAMALATPEDLGHRRAAFLDNLALVEKRMGHYDEALRLSTESLAQHRRLGDHAGVALCLNNLATLYLVRHEYDTARAHLEEALAVSEREGELFARTYILSTLSEVALKTGDWRAARDWGERALETAQRNSNRGVACWMKLHLARVALRTGDIDAARRWAAVGAEESLSLGAAPLKAVVLLTLAELLEAQHEPGVAHQVLAFAASHPLFSVLDREELAGELAQRGVAPDPAPAWPRLSLDELLSRVAAEHALAHRPLIAFLRGAT